MKLSVFERLVLLGLLPKEGDLTTVKIVRKMREDLSFSDEEHKILNFQTEGQQIRWEEGVEPVDINFGDKATEIIVEALKDLDKNKKMTEAHLDLYAQFIEQ